MTALYSLLSASRTQERNLEVTSNNLSNVNTPGFKADRPAFKTFLKQAYGQPKSEQEQDFSKSDFLSPYNSSVEYVITNDVLSDYDTPGGYKTTGGKLDFAIQGDGFFAVDSATGRKYTRDGQFQKNHDGFLVDSQGSFVVGSNGPIQIQGKEVSVTEDGILEVDGNFVDQLKIVAFDQPASLTKLGASYVVPSQDSQIPQEVNDKITLRQGMVEESNVSMVKEMTNLITTNRSFDAAQRAIRVMDGLEESSISLAR